MYIVPMIYILLTGLIIVLSCLAYQIALLRNNVLLSIAEKQLTLLELLQDHFKILNHKLKTIMANDQALIDKVDGLTTQMSKISIEVQALKDAVANQSNPSPELLAAVDRLSTAVQGVDDLNTDAQPQ